MVCALANSERALRKGKFTYNIKELRPCLLEGSRLRKWRRWWQVEP
jgi:hypothetical protein